MHWEKIGQIFDPRQHPLAQGCSIYAKSPQALELDDRIRVYFSSQKQTPNGKWISIPQFADYTKDFKTLLGVSTDLVIANGALGAFDEHGIFPFHVMTHENRILAYTCGWSRRVSVSVDMAIGFAQSHDGGNTFTRLGLGGPIMTAAPNEPCMVGDPFVRFYNGQFYMWYIFGTPWQNFPGQTQPDRLYKLAQATSRDGITWARTGTPIIPDILAHECQALPSVITIKDRTHMIFCYRNAYDFRTNPENTYRLGYAFSDDLINWTRDDSLTGIERSAEGWDSQMMCYPHLFACGDHIYLLYNGNDFGKDGFGLARLTDA